MDPFELLKADHKKVAELFDKLEGARGKTKLDVFKTIKSELELHTQIEEKFLYPALEKPVETHDLTLEAEEEHKVVKTLLAELSGAQSASGAWQARATVLRENVEHHVKEEENELFGKAEDALSDEELEAIGDKMAAEKARKQGKPAPQPAVAKSAQSNKANADKPGILSRIADLVGLGGSKTAMKKSPAKKKTAAGKGSKTAPKKSSSKAGSRSSAKTATKRSSATQGLKRASGPRTSSASKAGGAKGKKASKKRTGRK
ncbi:MAG: hemerythrin domain-containing protein [Acidobacteriota bacterium]|nr:hemerythrin domain-containing protein [Acidobacteriota bacterium]